MGAWVGGRVAGGRAGGQVRVRRRGSISMTGHSLTCRFLYYNKVVFCTNPLAGGVKGVMGCDDAR